MKELAGSGGSCGGYGVVWVCVAGFGLERKGLIRGCLGIFLGVLLQLVSLFKECLFGFTGYDRSS